MTNEAEKARGEFRALGYIIPEWLLGQNPKLVTEGGRKYFVVEGGVAFEAEMFLAEEVMKRYELITRFSN